MTREQDEMILDAVGRAASVLFSYGVDPKLICYLEQPNNDTGFIELWPTGPKGRILEEAPVFFEGDEHNLEKSAVIAMFSLNQVVVGLLSVLQQAIVDANAPS